MTVGENIKRIRKEKELTQKKLGELCNPPISESNIRKYENFNVSTVNNLPMTEKEKQLLASFRELDSHSQDYVLLTMEMLKKIP